MILCCGEALIDMVPEPTVSGHEGFVPRCGGAVFNTAIALGRLHTRTAMFTGLSNDLFGEQLLNELSASNVNTNLVVRSERPTTLAFVRLKNAQANYTFYDENSAGRMLEENDIPTLPHEVSTLFFGGISLACEPCAEAYSKLAKNAANDHVIMLDPNIRTGFINDEKRYRDRLNAMITYSDILKISDEDLAWIDNGPAPTTQKIKHLLAKGPSLIVLTRGSEGAEGYLTAGEVITIPAQKTNVIDTIGAGDSFNAGILASLYEQGLLSKRGISSLNINAAKQALEFGAHIAAVTVSRAGANPPWLNELTTN